MVLQPRGCGRVGRRRTTLHVEATPGWPLRHFGRFASTMIDAAPTRQGPGRVHNLGCRQLRPQARLSSEPTVGWSHESGCRRGSRMTETSEKTVDSHGYNKVVLQGKVSAAPEHRELPSGDSVWVFRVVVPRA